MRAMVTGAGGFVGAHLSARLVTDGWTVVGVVRPGGEKARLTALGVGGAVEIIEADLSDRRATVGAARAADPDVVFLLAARRAHGTPDERAATAAVNASSAPWLVDALPERSRVVVRLGSSTEYSEVEGYTDESAPLRPRGFFGATKAAGSLLAAATAGQRGLRAAILRPFQIYGPLDHPARLVPRALAAAREGAVLPLTEPGRRRDWVFVDDVVEATVRAALGDHLSPGQVINIGTGRQVANEEVVAEIERVTGCPVEVDAGAHPGREWDTGSWVCDPSLARQLLGWEAKIDLAAGLARCWEWGR